MAKTYALVGTGGRARMFYEAILGPHKDQSRLVALCDTNQVRMDYTNRVIEKEFGGQALPTYKAADFAAMLAAHKPDTVIVTSIDRTHHLYIIAALEAGCDVITEKPMTTDPEKCQAILDAVERTGKSVRVTFGDHAFFIPLNSAGMKVKAQGVFKTKTLSKEHVEHLINDDGAKFDNRNPDGTVTEVSFDATGVELRKS